jgi:hypothetical protein
MSTGGSDDTGGSGGVYSSITFAVPSYLSPGCLYSHPACSLPTQLVIPGVYPVSVTNANGTSNQVNFTVTAAISAPAPTSTPNPYSPTYPPTSLNIQDANKIQMANTLNSLQAQLQGLLWQWKLNNP